MLLNSKNKSYIARLLSDWFLTIIVLVISQKFTQIFSQPTKRGYFCDDESLAYPYHEDTITSTQLMLITLGLPILVIILGESLLYLVAKQETPENSVTLNSLLRFHHNLLTFLVGFALQTIFVQSTKITMGRLRPHFFQVCQPSRLEDASTCDDPKNHGIYIENYECRVKNDASITSYMLDSVYKSFPSGHASYIFYGMIFVILYLQRFAKNLNEYRIKVGVFHLVIQMLFALLAWLVALSRVMDNKHHWSDVLVGSVLGTSVAIVVSLYVRQQLKSVNNCPEGGKSSRISDTTSTTTFSMTSKKNILVP